MQHQALSFADGIHVIHNWSVADATARAALTVAITDIGKVCYQQDTKKFYILESVTPSVWNGIAFTTAGLIITDAGTYYPATQSIDAAFQLLGKAWHKNSIMIAAGDETTALTTGTGKVTFRLPYAMLIESVKASLTTAQTSGTLLQIDVKKAGVSIFTTKPTLNNTSKTTVGATTASVLDATKTTCADDDEITIDISAIGDGTAKGLKVYLIGKII